MLDRARMQSARGRPTQIPLAEVEGLVGLKVQAIANDPKRRRRDEDDIVRLLERHMDSFDMTLLPDYFATFDLEKELEALLDEARQLKS